MGVLSDRQIEAEKIIEPFVRGQRSDGCVSFGSSSYGYDSRLGYKFKIFTPALCAVIDPKNFDPRSFVAVDRTPPLHAWEKQFFSMRHPRTWKCQACGLEVAYEDHTRDEEVCPELRKLVPDSVLIPPNSFALGESLETFTIPRDVLAIVLGKSTYARCSVVVNLTPHEPEWIGKVTVEMSNTSPLPVKVYPGEGIMQVVFLRTDDPQGCITSYADRRGRYQNQEGLTLPTVNPVKEQPPQNVKEEDVLACTSCRASRFVPNPDKGYPGRTQTIPCPHCKGTGKEPPAP